MAKCQTQQVHREKTFNSNGGKKIQKENYIEVEIIFLVSDAFGNGFVVERVDQVTHPLECHITA